MNDDYLWNREGEPDEETRRLEELLGAFRAPLPPLRIPRTARPASWLLAAAAALVALGIGVPALLAWRANGWCEAGSLVPLRAGQVVSATRIESPAIGVVDVAAGTMLRIGERRRLALESGRIHARTTSPPGVFIVDTPSATAVDLGCEYDLSVAKDGSGSLRVTDGWVELQRGFTQSLVPRGASAQFDALGQLMPPVFDDADPELKAALRRLSFGGGDRAADLGIVLGRARKRDALTLVNLFSRTNAEERVLVYDRLDQLVPAPQSIPRTAMQTWTPAVTGAWWSPVMRASGVTALKKKKR